MKLEGIENRFLRKYHDMINIYGGYIFEPVGELKDVFGFKTQEHLRKPPEEGWEPVRDGYAWGGEFGSLWLKGTAVVPEEAVGKKLYATENTGAREVLFFVDGKPCGIFNRREDFIGGWHSAEFIGVPEKEGQTYDLAFECYAWHFEAGCRPYDNYHRDMPDEHEFDKVYHSIELCVMNEEVKEFVFNLRNLVQLAGVLNDDNQVKHKAMALLKELFPHTVQMPKHYDKQVWMDSVRKCNEIMKPFYQKENTGLNTYGHVGMIGHSHMDTAWLWPVDETVRKCARTYANALSLMEQYPEYKFVQSSVLHSWWMKEYYPDIFEKMKQRVKEGRYEPNGGAWVECDCNITSGEFMVRQFLKGQNFTRENFGYTADCFWLPDTFGYNANIPQIMQGCNIKYFYTTKIGWNELNRFPMTTFNWKGIDGSQVLTHFNTSNSVPDAHSVVRVVEGIQNKDDYDGRMMAFGFGDGGGGPTFGQIEDARRVMKSEGIPKASYMTISEFMHEAEKGSDKFPVYNDELYLELHRGTLTQMHEIKRNNRKAEFAVRNLEAVNVMSKKPALPELDGYIKTLLKNQFHDILPGTSITPVNTVAKKEVSELISTLDNKTAEIVSGLTDNGGLTVINTLSFERNDVFYIDGEKFVKGAVNQSVTDISGKNKTAVGGIVLKPFSAVSFELQEKAEQADSPFVYHDNTLETPFALVEFDECGFIDSFVDKQSGRELRRQGGAPLNTFYMGEDVPLDWDDWDIDRDFAMKQNPQRKLIKREVAADGALEFIIRSEYEIGTYSTLKQDMIFYSNSPRVDFDTIVDWKDKHCFLKVGFDVDVLARYAKHEIQFGHVERPTYCNTSIDAAKFEVCNYKWTDISENRFGAAVLNDCKYGVSVKDSDIRLSLHKGGCRPDVTGDAGVHRMTYSLLPHGAFGAENTIRESYKLNIPPLAYNGTLKSEIKPVAEISESNIICEALKPAENRSDAYVMRLYESERNKTRCTVSFSDDVKKVYLTNMLEDVTEEIPMSGNRIEIEFSPFEIKTLMIIR